MAQTLPDDDTLRIGLLMESAQTQQRLAQTQLDRLQAHTRGIDGIVREEIRRTLTDEIRALHVECERAALALRGVQRAVTWRSLAGSLALGVVCLAVPASIGRWLLPSADDIGRLRTERDALARNVAQLEQQGGRVQWRRCGDTHRLCVRVDRQAPVYGGGDYLVVAGY